jgi:prepilin-type processing-associated H-X9-DG protein
MKKITSSLAVLAALSFSTAGLPGADKPAPAAAPPGLAIREIHYDGRLADDEARFTVDIDAEAGGTGESGIRLFEGDIALLPMKLPGQLKILRQADRYLLVAAHPGRFKFTLDLVARIQRAEPWNRISFSGPTATIASVAAEAGGTGMEVQLLNGTLRESVRTNGVSRVTGFLGADATVALRWSRLGGTAEVARKALLTVDSTIAAHVTPTFVKYTSRFHYEIVQGAAAQLTLALPASQALTRLKGEQIRDWRTTTEGDRQILTIEFIKPVESAYDLTLYSEQTAEGAASAASLNPPQPLEVERESGALNLAAEDTLVEIVSLSGLRQVNAADKTLAAYRFNARPFTLALKLRRIEPVINVADRVGARLEETRLIVAHGLTLNIEKAGIYALELAPQPGFAVAEVRGDGVEDWKVSDGKLRVNFSARVLGVRRLDVQLEQPLKTFPEHISLSPLRVTGAARETAQIGAASAAGIQLRTAELAGLREIPVNRLQDRADELLAFNAEQPDWTLALGSERLAARIVADVFNLVTIGEGIVGGSATIRYGLVNQGVQEFKVRLPAHCRNIEFTGPNIRRKEQAGDLWMIGLQDKAWGGYTLVVTYDYQFDPQGATLPIGGVHTVDVEHETGSVAITTAASLQLSTAVASDTLRRVDEAELSPADRALITRAVVLGYQYAGGEYELAVDVKRYAEEPILEAVADRTQITSVLNEAGEMLTQASFMVKNNQKQFQRFQLPKDAKLWGSYVNGQPARPERDGDAVLVPLPRDLNRDQAFAVDIMYSQTNGPLAARWSKTLSLAAPRTDVPNTYAEWQLFVPATFRLSDFGGSMNVAQGTTYALLDAWEKFIAFYLQVLREAGRAILVIGFLAFLVVALVISAVRRGWNGIITVLVVVAILAVLGAMMLPALAKAKCRAQRICSVNNLKQIGLAVRIFADDNGDRMPVSYEEMMNELNTDKITYDVETGQQFTYLGAGMSLNDITPDSVIAHGPVVNGHCNVLMADGSVQSLSARAFAELNQRGLIRRTGPQQVAAQQQEVVRRSQFAAAPVSEPARSEARPIHAGSEAGAPAAGGYRSIRIELPQTGQPFLFTKVLNIRDEPLSIRARIMSLHTFQTLQMAWQAAAFVLGLAVWWWQWRRTHRNSFILTVALALILGSVASLLIQWRALHDALIIGFPVVAVAVIAWLVWKFWPRGSAPEPVVVPEPPPLTVGAPPAAIAIALLFALNLAGADAAEPGPSIVSASYSGTVNDRVALLDAVLQFSSATAGQTVMLFDEDVAVQKFKVRSGRARLIRDGNRLAVRFGRTGDVTLQVSMLAKVAGDVTQRRLAFNIPPALSSQVALVLDQPEADVDFPAAISTRRFLDHDKTRVEAVIGSGDRVELLWTPRVKRAAEVAATVFCHNSALVTIGGGVVNVRSVMDYQVTQGELRQARVRLPAGHRLLRVEGLSIRTWQIKNGAGDGPAETIGNTSRTSRVPCALERNAAVPAAAPCGRESLTNLPGAGPGEAAAGGTPALRFMERLPRTSIAPCALEPTDGSAGLRPGLWSLAKDTMPGRRPALRFMGRDIESGDQILVVDLLKGIPSDWRLTVETERVLEPLPASVEIALPAALDVKRETGLVALRNAEELGLSVESASDLQRVDVEEFARSQPGADQTGGLVSVFRFSKPEFGLRVRAEAVRPQIEAVVRNSIRLGTDQAAISATIDYTIKRAGVFALRTVLPGGYRVETVTGNNVLQWIERKDGTGTTELEVTLKERTLGAYSLRLELARSFQELPKSFAVAGVHPLDTVKLVGFVAVSAEAGVAIKTEAFDGLTEIPVTALFDAGLPSRSEAEAGSVLAYKFISAEPKSTPEWKLSVATEPIEAWARAEIVNTLTLAENRVSGRALVRYDIANAPVKELRVRVPAAFRNVEITGANIRSKEILSRAPEDAADTNHVVWRVELQSKVRGLHTLTVTWEQPRVPKTNAVELAGISADGVERETGFLAIAAKAPLQVSELAAAGAQRADTADFPDWAGRPPTAAVLAYRYVRPGYQITVNARRFAEAEVLQALVDNARLTTVVAEDGQMMTEMALSVRNNGRQFLEVELPAEATVCSVFVAGQPVRPSRHEGRLLLPIEQAGAYEGAVSVELTYFSTNTFPHARGEVAFASPKFDAPLKNARWELFLPQDFDYRGFEGTMTRETSAAQTASASFSKLDYSLMEKANRDSAKA